MLVRIPGNSRGVHSSFFCAASGSVYCGIAESPLVQSFSMPRPLAVVLSELNGLAALDFDYSNPSARGLERLGELCDELVALNAPAESIPAMLGVIERLDDIDLGTPGSLVHTMETWRGSYETLLAASMQRKPAYLTTWMVNRILNSDPPSQRTWLDLLVKACLHPLASEATRAAARDFVDFQLSRRRRIVRAVAVRRFSLLSGDAGRGRRLRHGLGAPRRVGVDCESDG